MLVKDLQQFLGTFTDKLKGNAISTARIYVERDGYLEEIKRMEVQENPMIGQTGIRLVLKTSRGPWSVYRESFSNVPWIKNHGA
jgi:hypothetical protein